MTSWLGTCDRFDSEAPAEPLAGVIAVNPSAVPYRVEDHGRPSVKEHLTI